ncbi:MAG: hypothetical protein M3385_08095 [Actinomycetota bacterium]|nr:hypothetical protein [Actinomycetota bacterium]
MPDPRRPPSVEELRRNEAVGFFVERAKAVASTFELTDKNAQAVARLCHKLEAWPVLVSR